MVTNLTQGEVDSDRYREVMPRRGALAALATLVLFVASAAGGQAAHGDRGKGTARVTIAAVELEITDPLDDLAVALGEVGTSATTEDGPVAAISVRGLRALGV